MPKPYDYMLKLLLVGDSSVGKSSLLWRYTEGADADEYIDDRAATVGVDFKVKMMTMEGHSVKACLWDTAGQCVLCSLPRPLFFFRADALALV